MTIISIRENPGYLDRAVNYFQRIWASERSRPVYEDAIRHALCSDNPLPQWYLLEENDRIVGCAGLITNDFISRQDLFPWICALYIDPDFRGRRLGSLLLDRAAADAGAAGFSNVYLCTDHSGYYEKFGFSWIASGYHPWGDSSKIYSRPCSDNDGKDCLHFIRRTLAATQTGLAYGQNEFDLQRYRELQKLSIGFLNELSRGSRNMNASVIFNETGYATPKIAVRGVIFRDGKICCVKEKDTGRWSLPGAWADVDASPREMVEREVREESGFIVKAQRCLGIFDSNRHRTENTLYHVYRLYILCDIQSEAYPDMLETVETDFFARDLLPPLSEGKNSREEILAVFRFLDDPNADCILE